MSKVFKQATDVVITRFCVEQPWQEGESLVVTASWVHGIRVDGEFKAFPMTKESLRVAGAQARSFLAGRIDGALGAGIELAVIAALKAAGRIGDGTREDL
jgi:hypothetical protein